MHGKCFQMNYRISNSFSFEKDIQYFTLREEIILHPRIFKISNFSFETCPNNMNSIFNICFVFFNSTSNQFPTHRESLYLSFLFNTFISNINNILTFGWWRVNNEGTQIWTRVEKREKNEEYILVKDMEGLNGKKLFTRVEIFSQKGNDPVFYFFSQYLGNTHLEDLPIMYVQWIANMYIFCSLSGGILTKHCLSKTKRIFWICQVLFAKKKRI